MILFKIWGIIELTRGIKITRIIKLTRICGGAFDDLHFVFADDELLGTQIIHVFRGGASEPLMCTNYVVHCNTPKIVMLIIKKIKD